MLIRTDPFRELDRLTQQLLTPQGTMARPAAMLMDAWREGDSFYVELDLPGVSQDSIDIDVERNVVTVRAERPARASDVELVAAERPRGVFSRQLVLGDNLENTVDFRRVYATMIDEWLGADATSVLGQKFETLKMFRA